MRVTKLDGVKLRILETIGGTSEVYQSEIARKLGVSRQLLTPHIKWLLGQGHIKMISERSRKKLVLADTEYNKTFTLMKAEPLHTSYMKERAKARIIFSRRQEVELINSIGGRGEIPVKFHYLGKGSHNWDVVYRKRRREGGTSSTEYDLISGKVARFIDALPPRKQVNVIDIGCGNGLPVVPILKGLRKIGVRLRYVPIDINKGMLSLAADNIRKTLGEVEIMPIEFDFERGNFLDMIYDLKSIDSVNLMIFFGNTLGNQPDIHRVLTNFRESMTASDFLIVGNELTNTARIDRILSQYKSSDVVEFVYYIPEYVGIKREYTDLVVSWNEKLYRVEMNLVMKKDLDIKIAHEKIALEKGEKILVLISKKFTDGSLTELFSDTGFRTELLTTNFDDSVALVMVQPTRHTN